MVDGGFWPLAAAAPLIIWLVSWAGLVAPSPSTLDPDPVVALAACRFGASEGSSLCKGDECIGDADFLLCESPLPLLPPLDELRGDTRPV